MPLLIAPVAPGPRLGCRPYVRSQSRHRDRHQRGLRQRQRRSVANASIVCIIADRRVAVIRDDHVVAVIAARPDIAARGLVTPDALGLRIDHALAPSRSSCRGDCICVASPTMPSAQPPVFFKKSRLVSFIVFTSGPDTATKSQLDKPPVSHG